MGRWEHRNIESLKRSGWYLPGYEEGDRLFVICRITYETRVTYSRAKRLDTFIWEAYEYGSWTLQKSRAIKCVRLLRSLEFRILYLQERHPPQEMRPVVGVRNATSPEPPSHTTSKPVKVAKFLIFHHSLHRRIENIPVSEVCGSSSPMHKVLGQSLTSLNCQTLA